MGMGVLIVSLAFLLWNGVWRIWYSLRMVDGDWADWLVR